MVMEIKPVRKVWRGIEFDSQLEADWCATLVAWGMEFEYHPGWMVFDDGERWEPDFLCDGDWVLEVKGSHDERLWKARRAADEFGLKVVVGRTAWMPGGSDLEVAGAVWESSDVVVMHDDELRRAVFMREDEITGEWENPPMYSAVRAFTEGLLGIRAFKAVDEDEIR